MAERKRRHNGEGSVYRATDGRWVARISLGTDPATGKPRRKVVYAKTEAEARAKLKTLHAQHEYGELNTAPGRVPTVRAWLIEWMARREASVDFTDRTNERVRSLCERHIIPALGHIQLSQLTAPQVKGMTDRLQRNRTGSDGKPLPPLSGGSVFQVRATLRAALNDAIKERLILRNAAAEAKPPKRNAKEMATLSPDQVETMVAAADTVPEGNLWVLLAKTGLRLGEALGLTWDDYDPETGVLHVRKQLQRVRTRKPEIVLPDGKRAKRRMGAVDDVYRLEPLKTAKSRRDLPLPAAARAAIEDQRKRQVRERLAAGSKWQNDIDLIFTTPRGRPMESFQHRAVFQSFLMANGLPVVRIHDLRHTFASITLARVPTPGQITKVSRWLGHSNVTTTMNVYNHVIAGGLEELRDSVDSLAL